MLKRAKGGNKKRAAAASPRRGRPEPTRRRAGHAARAARAARIIARLKRRFPEARCSLEHRDPLQLLVATILSAQCTDARVNAVTRGLFEKYRTAGDYATADPAVFQREIQSTGFFRNKTKSILGMAQELLARFGGAVPDTMDALTSLPGVGRKTANVVLGNAFGKDEGVVVDTHVARIAGRLRLSRHADPDKIEQDLMRVVPRKEWTLFPHLLIHHGRAICVARKPRCQICPV
ncbi:MAG: endonuclease III, partial [Gemmatimonadetes bacterium]|nr:endonuclease III [Gemmatimonadota bacterium]